MAAFAAIGGVPCEILYDRMKTPVIGETVGSIVYNRAFIDFARHYGFQPRACRPYRAKTTDEVYQLFLCVVCYPTDARGRPRDKESGVR
jgi:transposase